MKGERVTVTTGATLIVDGGTGNVNFPQSAVLKIATGGQSVFLGGATVTTTAGYELEAAQTISVDLVGDDLYGIVTATTQGVQVLRNGA